MNKLHNNLCIYYVLYELMIFFYRLPSWCIFFCTDFQGHWVFANNEVVCVDNGLTELYFVRIC